ncbi:MAG TPA: multicopper oxidase [Steroidobacteraceae bacterium]
MTSRRTFLKSSSLAAAGLAARRLSAHPMPALAPAAPNLNPDTLARFVDPLPRIPIARALAHKPGEVASYRMAMRQITRKLHRDLPGTSLWCYGDSFPGPLFETRKGEALEVEWANELPQKHFLPIDHSLHGAEASLPEVRGVVHLHGGKTPPESDGWPEDWIVPGQSRRYRYPNDQEAALLWYHDHAMGINRLNIYAGLLGLHVVRDAGEDALNLPKGDHEIPLVILDRDIGRDGQLSYPVAADPKHPWVPEFFGETQLVNGKIFPYLNVEARKYRLRILNGANGRFYRLAVKPEVPMHQIGSDQGLLAAPVAVKYVQLAPGERADVVVDFSQSRGAKLELVSDAFTLMQFRVDAKRVSDASELPKSLRPIDRLDESRATVTRRLTLDENQNLVAESLGMLLNKTPWHAPITEKPRLGSTEIWEFVNLTEDVHPIHLHLVRFQILDRRSFDWFQYMTQGSLRFLAPPMPPDANEMGWKDTVRVNAKTVTRIIVPFEGFAGKYVWHCHILEHEDNEMMRPYEVLRA